MEALASRLVTVLSVLLIPLAAFADGSAVWQRIYPIPILIYLAIVLVVVVVLRERADRRSQGAETRLAEAEAKISALEENGRRDAARDEEKAHELHERQAQVVSLREKLDQSAQALEQATTALSNAETERDELQRRFDDEDSQAVLVAKDQHHFDRVLEALPRDAVTSVRLILPINGWVERQIYPVERYYFDFNQVEDRFFDPSMEAKRVALHEAAFNVYVTESGTSETDDRDPRIVHPHRPDLPEGKRQMDAFERACERFGKAHDDFVQSGKTLGFDLGKLASNVPVDPDEWTPTE